MKSLLLFVTVTFFSVKVFSQGATLPYYTGFDTPAQKAGWQQYRTGFVSMYGWSNTGSISHDYNVGGNANDTVIDWYVSPVLNIPSFTTMSFKISASGFSTPTTDNCEIWFGSNHQNPTQGNFSKIANLSAVTKNTFTDTSITIPFSSDSGFIAFKYKTIGAAWMTYNIDSITIGTTVGIHETLGNRNLQCNVFPNPIVQSSKISFDVKVNNATAFIYNISGQSVASIEHIKGNSFTLNKGDLPEGVYFIKLIDNGTEYGFHKIVIGN